MNAREEIRACADWTRQPSKSVGALVFAAAIIVIVYRATAIMLGWPS